MPPSYFKTEYLAVLRSRAAMVPPPRPSFSFEIPQSKGICLLLPLLLLQFLLMATTQAFIVLPPGSPTAFMRSSPAVHLMATTTAATSTRLMKGVRPTAPSEPLIPPPIPTHPVPQILAPAGGREQFLAALNSGADQVFLGLKSFNARARAENFGVEDLRNMVPLAHRYGMKVLVTVNVLIKENEFSALLDVLSALEELEVDAIIVQDQAVGTIVQQFFPTLTMHASTQMAVHNLQGVIKAAALGYRRVVLARELTAKEMKDIRAGVKADVTQLEAFAHGSLCYSYSGLCLFSGETDARSGNRGECSYSCREPYKLTSEDGMGFLFSMADLDTSHDLDLLAEAGIDTLKIEGRKKDAQYVASSVALYRRRLDQLYQRPTLRPLAPPEAQQTVNSSSVRPEAFLRQDLSLSFHRGTTSFFVRGRYHENVIDLNNAGHLGVPAGRVSYVSKDGKTFRFTPEVDLERYDGIKITPPSRAFHSTPQHGSLSSFSPEEGTAPGTATTAAAAHTKLLHEKYANDLPEFSLRNFKVQGSKAFNAMAGAVVDVEIPIEIRRSWEQQPDRFRMINRGDVVFQSRSNELKRRVEALTTVPDGYKSREWRKVDVGVEVRREGGREGEAGGLELCVKVSKLGQVLVEDKLVWQSFEYSMKKTKEGVIADIVEVLGTYGELGFRADAVVIDGLDDGQDEGAREGGKGGKGVPFIRRKDLKVLKAKVAETLTGAYEAFVMGRKQRAVAGLGISEKSSSSSSSSSSSAAAPVVPLPARMWDERRFAIKFDRPEYLDMLDLYLSSMTGREGGRESTVVKEVVFEPKRMYLADVKPEDGVARLMAFGARHGVRVRLALPTVVRAWDMTPLKGWVEAFVAAHAQQQQQQQQQRTPPVCFEVGNLGAWGLLEEWGVLSSSSPPAASSPRVDVTTDFTLYSLNSQASAMWARTLGASRIALSVEDDKENLKAHMQAWPRAMNAAGAGAGAGAGAAGTSAAVGDECLASIAPQYILYKDVPLFMAEACSLTALHGNSCPGSKVCGYRTLSIENEQGEKFEVAHEHCKSIVYSTKAQSLVHRQKDLLGFGVRDFRLDFLTRKYDKKQFFEVLDAALRREEGDEEALPNTHVANFDRKLL